jgi:hypothetical protein
METILNLDSEQYSDFLKCLLNLKEICNDVDIRGGMIRQRSNDLSCIFEMNLAPIINEANIPITNLKKKLDLLRVFVGQDVKFKIVEGESESDSYFTISDDESSIKFLFPAIEFMDNKIISQKELDNIFNVDDEDLILENDLSSVVTERIKVVTENFNTQAIQMKFKNDQASITATTQSKDQTAKFKTEIPININFEGNYISNLSTVPFSIDYDEEKLNFKMYKDPKQNVALNRIEAELGDVKIKVFSRSAIIEES